MDPWRVGPQPVYDPNSATSDLKFDPPRELCSPSFPGFQAHRAKLLREWGTKRESEMHRAPKWCMDQLVSGSGLFPPRLLSNAWFTTSELVMISSLEQLLAATGSAASMARDMMALLIYDVDVRIVCDDSGSMGCGMLSGYGQSSSWTARALSQVFGDRAFSPDSVGSMLGTPFGPGAKRWTLLRDALEKWERVFQIMGIPRKLHFLNQNLSPDSALDDALKRGPSGGTPMGSTFQSVLQEHQRNNPHQSLLLLAVTDGEANDAWLFNNTLDQIQDGCYGDVQVCLLGVSLQPEDIAWFEDEECDDTRIRTIEAFEVEQQQILWRKVIQRSTDYNFEMHTYRALVTNYFPADYDYEAPVQTLRHRLYITLHALDRRFTGCRDNRYTYVEDIDCSSCLGPCFSMLFGGNSTGRQPLLKLDDNVLELEGFGQEDGGLGILFETLRRQSLNRSYVDGTVLRLLQSAIGALQPSELQMRDLQYSDANENRRVVSKALIPLRKAARIIS